MLTYQLPEVQGIGDVIECGDRENLQLLPRFEHLQELLLLVDVTWLARLLKDNAHEEFDVLTEATNILTLDVLEDRVHNQDENVLAIRVLRTACYRLFEFTFWMICLSVSQILAAKPCV